MTVSQLGPASGVRVWGVIFDNSEAGTVEARLPLPSGARVAWASVNVLGTWGGAPDVTLATTAAPSIFVMPLDTDDMQTNAATPASGATELVASADLDGSGGVSRLDVAIYVPAVEAAA